MPRSVELLSLRGFAQSGSSHGHLTSARQRPLGKREPLKLNGPVRVSSEIKVTRRGGPASSVT